MTQPCPARVGDPLDAVDTPALIVDLDVYERNLDRMAALVGETGVRLRPHAKTHKSPVIALDQIARGAVGVCCQKLSEAEVLAAGGVRDILIANEIVGPGKAARLAALNRNARVAVCIDHPDSVEALSKAARDFGTTIDVLVEIDVGAGRCGVEPGDAAAALAQQATAAAGLRFAGLQAYHGGAQHIRAFGERRDAVSRAADLTRATIDTLRRAGLDCETVTGGGTGSLPMDLDIAVLTELQAGSYVFMDADYARNLDEAGEFECRFENALFVLATVMSRPAPGRAVLDAGLKALAMDSGPPVLPGIAGASFTGASDEHGTLTIKDDAALRHGERIHLIPGHCDPTVNLYDWYVGFRGDRVEQVWPVAARGALS